MRRMLAGALLLALALPVGAADKDKKKSQYQPTQDDIDALIQMKVAVGKISKVEGTTKGFTFIYQAQYTVPDQKKLDAANRPLVRQQQSLARQQQQAQRIKNAAKRAAKLQSIAAKLQNLQLKAAANAQKYIKVVPVRKDFDLQATSKTKIRLMKLPVQYDDKGNVKEYSEKEKLELKGKDKDQPGYEGNWDNVAEGQTVKVYVKAHKKKKETKDKEDAADKKDDAKDKKDVDKDKKENAKEAKADAKEKKEDVKKDGAKEKNKDDEEDEDLVDDDRPLVTKIIILEQPDADKDQKNK